MKSKSVHNKVGRNQLGTFNVNRFIYQGFNKPKATPAENKSKSGGQLKGSMTSRKWKWKPKKIKREDEKRPKAARDVFRAAVLY